MIEAEGQNAFLSEQKRYPELVRPQNFCRYISIITILSLTTFNCGYCLCYTTALGTNTIGLIYGLMIHVHIIKALTVSALSYGVAFGVFLNPWILPRASRRNMTLILCIIGTVLQSILQVQYLVVLAVTRFFQGIITGLLLENTLYYVRELSPKQLNQRDLFGIIGQIFLMIGFMVVFGVNIIVTDLGTSQNARWRFVVSFNFLTLIIIIIGILTKIIPQSPNNLILKGQIDEAKNVIGLFHKQSDIEEVYNQKLNEIQKIKNPPPSENRSIIQKILIFQPLIMHQLVGVTALISQMGFVTNRWHKSFGNYVPFIMGTTQIIATMYTLIYFKKIKRSSLIVIGNLGMSLCCFALGVMYEVTQDTQQAFWGIEALLIVYMAINGLTLVPGVMLFVQSFATRKQLRWSKFVFWFTGATSILLFIYVGQTYTYAPMFYSYGTITMLFFVFNARVLIKIKPKNKKQINFELRKLSISSHYGDDDKQNGEKL